MKLLIDCYGLDLGFKPMVDGVKLALEKKSFIPVFVGNREEIEGYIKSKIDKYEIIDAKVYISNDEDPVRAIRRKKDSSLRIAFDKLNEDEYDGLLSAGSTGAILAGGLFVSKRIEGIDRAALAARLPARKGVTILMDTGANMDSRPEFLEEFAIMGKIYLENVLKIKDPKIGLLNVGVESHKGDKLSKNTYKLLKERETLNFVGNIEARDLFTGKVNLILADGFAGNVAIKTAEGVMDIFKDELKDIFYGSFKNKLAALSLKSDLKANLSKYSVKNIGGAPLLGVKSYVYKAHGNSDDISISNALLGLISYIDTKVIEKIQGELND